MYQPKTYVLIIVLIAGVGVSYLGLQDLLWMGSQWLSSNDSWGLNTYTSVPAKTAFLYAGVISLWTGGLCAGAAVVLILTKLSKTSLVPFFLAIVFTGLGFNTLDWMISPSPGRTFQAWPLSLSFELECWNWYIFLGVAPSFLGGLLICMPLTYAALKTAGKI